MIFTGFPAIKMFRLKSNIVELCFVRSKTVTYPANVVMRNEFAAEGGLPGYVTQFFEN